MSFEKKNPGLENSSDSFHDQIMNKMRGSVDGGIQDARQKKIESCKKYVDATMETLPEYSKDAEGNANGFFSSIDVYSTQYTFDFEMKSPIGFASMTTSMGGEHSKYKINEDAVGCYIGDEVMVVEVFDGAGGSGHGQLASAVGLIKATEEIIAGVPLQEVGQHIHASINEKTPGGYAAGVILKAHKDGKVEALYAADTRMMTLRNGEKLLEGTTKFQNMAASVLEIQAQKPVEEQEFFPKDFYIMNNLNLIMGSFGGSSPYRVEPGEIMFQSQEGDMVVIATDGVWDNVSDYEIVTWAKEYSDPKQLREKIMNEALARNNVMGEFVIQHDADTFVKKTLYKERNKDHGWGDNITVAVVRLQGGVK